MLKCEPSYEPILKFKSKSWFLDSLAICIFSCYVPNHWGWCCTYISTECEAQFCEGENCRLQRVWGSVLRRINKHSAECEAKFCEGEISTVQSVRLSFVKEKRLQKRSKSESTWKEANSSDLFTPVFFNQNCLCTSQPFSSVRTQVKILTTRTASEVTKLQSLSSWCQGAHPEKPSTGAHWL